MKRVLTVIVILLVIFRLEAKDISKLDKFIITSIETYIDNEKEFVRRGISVDDTCCFFVCTDGLPADFPSDSVQNVVFFSLNNISGLPSPFKLKLKKGIEALFIGLEISNSQIIITVSGRRVRRLKNNILSIAISDWGIFTYEYSCEKQKWEFLEPKFGGV